MIVNPMPSPTNRSAQYREALDELLAQQRLTRREFDLLRADKLHEYQYRLNTAFVIVLSVFAALLFVVPVSWVSFTAWAVATVLFVGYFILQCRHYRDQLAETFDPLTPKQATWIALMSERDDDFQQILTSWTATGKPLIQRDYHALRGLEILAHISFGQEHSVEA